MFMDMLWFVMLFGFLAVVAVVVRVMIITLRKPKASAVGESLSFKGPVVIQRTTSGKLMRRRNWPKSRPFTMWERRAAR